MVKALSPPQPRPRAAKGTVKVHAFRGRLRLSWTCAGKRYYLYVGLPADAEVNWKVAQAKAKLIESDIALERFDTTLNRYRPTTAQRHSAITAVGVWDAYCEAKARDWSETTRLSRHGYRAILKEFFDTRLAHLVTESLAWECRDFMLQRIKPVSVKQRIAELNAAWKWAMGKGLVSSNPWQPVQVKVPPKQRPKPFTQTEVHQIIQAFRDHKPHYADLVEFLFATGVRTGEATSLRWAAVSDDCSTVWIGETLTPSGQRKSTKTNRDRTLPMTGKLQAMLLSRRPEKPDPDALVFPAKGGAPIKRNTFRGVWKRVIELLGTVSYRKPYATRCTLVSYALSQGMNPVEVAQLTGHDVETLYQHYAGVVCSRPTLPEI